MTARGPKFGKVPATNLMRCESADEVVDRLIELYDAAIAQIEKNFEAFAKGKRKATPDPVYPYLGIEVEAVPRGSTLAFGKVTRPGFYGTTITAPRLFRAYLIEQLNLLTENTQADVYVGRSHTPIPLTFAV
ncbi:MAG: AMP nucleosidase, partial [Alphaproteobacteria bacterium]|nr:AMP nucleosidase [Alphaproteobacteria bacterium]